MRSTGKHFLIVPGALHEEVSIWAHDLDIGSEVGPVEGEDNYYVALAKGGFLFIENGVIRTFAEEVDPYWPIFDKWGNRLPEDVDAAAYYGRKEVEIEPLVGQLMEEDEKRFDGYGRMELNVESLQRIDAEKQEKESATKKKK